MKNLIKFCPLPVEFFDQGHWTPPKPGWSRARQLGHLASRLALALAYREGHGLSPARPAEDLEAALDPSNLAWFLTHQHTLLKEQANYRLSDQNLSFSRSHNPHWGAATLHTDTQFCVGLDIEETARPIKPGMEKFFVHPKDQPLPLLWLWVGKEAAFKALAPKLAPQVLTLKSIQIENWPEPSDNRFRFTAHHEQGELIFQHYLIDQRELLVAHAIS